MMNDHTALLIIDILNPFDFEHGKTLADHTTKMVKPLDSLRGACRQNNMPVIYINDHYTLWQADLKKIYDKCLNDISRPIIETLKPGKDDYFLIKPKHSAFYGTALNTLLHSLKVDTLILTGIAGNICVLFTANDAYMREFNLIIPEDCIASVSEDDNRYALEMMKNVLKADIVASGSILQGYY
ncbi:cysteine hydrolase [Rossellomorea vietnamensis]|uniref:Cysteine hydrolase n=1 Tax=Rossellomorea vietnamensis TaxID=218284 RepID=A0A5D4LZR1_9BACI|nr:isochorismatase family cysteine hydrolase [Rossellomorea vietnamensis]TYR94712.1 cysteine hydrolase [Rossellomorea vietnamensis]